MKAVLVSAVLIEINTFSISNVQAASGFNAEQPCKAGLDLAIDKQPRGIKVTSGKSNQRILLSLKDGNNDWGYRCDVNRGNKTIKLKARELKRNDKFSGQAIRYDVADAKRLVKVTMKNQKGSGIASESYTARQLK
ncbi:conserved hypothetical protein [Vibrio coralliirubri]|uniref:hypothetical protein n=1 Tax=Vibrio coralliirubri TaxID=1516159 RepID=UPI000637AB95|nr:hypothetical protein [Vibrio coralliirubri]CDT62215.1 conserved hypothetical protein [Vibrio coralliirubri]